ncbi:unnamed protein product, partial [Pleuronectes platessa]
VVTLLIRGGLRGSVEKGGPVAVEVSVPADDKGSAWPADVQAMDWQRQSSPRCELLALHPPLLSVDMSICSEVRITAFPAPVQIYYNLPSQDNSLPLPLPSSRSHHHNTLTCLANSTLGRRAVTASPIDLTSVCMSLDRGRKPEYLETRTHADRRIKF